MSAYVMAKGVGLASSSSRASCGRYGVLAPVARASNDTSGLCSVTLQHLLCCRALRWTSLPCCAQAQHLHRSAARRPAGCTAYDRGFAGPLLGNQLTPIDQGAPPARCFGRGQLLQASHHHNC
jgi:hypothetical protein